MKNNCLFKNTKNRRLGGVCSGLAEYLGIDVTIVRIAIAFLCLYNNACILIYFLMMVLLPDKSELADAGDAQLYTDSARHRRRLFGLSVLSLLLVAGSGILSRLFGRSFDYSDWFCIALGVLGAYLCVTGISLTREHREYRSAYLPRVLIGAAMLIFGFSALFSGSVGGLVTPFAALVNSAKYLSPLLLLAVGLTFVFPSRRSMLIIWLITAFIIIVSAIGSAVLSI